MKKVRMLWLSLILILLAVSGIYIKHLIVNDKKQNNADMVLKSNLSFAAGGFALDFDKATDDNQKQFYYNQAMSGTFSSSQLVGLTTYESKNDGLDIALYNLYKLMEQNEYRNIVMKNSKLIYDNLLRISQDPTDKEATENIIKLTEEIRHKQ